MAESKKQMLIDIFIEIIAMTLFLAGVVAFLLAMAGEPPAFYR